MRKQAGTMMLDFMIGAAISMMLLAALLQAAREIDAGRRAAREGSKLSTAVSGLGAYLKAKGALIVTTGSVSGFADPYAPTADELRSAGYLAPHFTTASPLGGTIIFAVQRDLSNNLLGLACDNRNVTERGAPAPVLVGRAMSAAGGTGLATNQVAPTVLNGAALQGIPSPVIGPAIVCAWAQLPNPA